MKIAVFGITGGTGKFFLPMALEYGYELRVLVRDVQKLGQIPEGVEVVQGDAGKYEDVRKTLEGTEAVVSLLGHSKNSPKNIQQTFGKQVIQAMQELDIHRLIILTGSGARVEGDKPNILDKLITAILKLVDSARLEDGQKHVEQIMASHLDWTIVRTPLQVDGPVKDSVVVGPVGKTGMSQRISRGNLVRFMLDILLDEKSFRQAPAITN